LEEILISIDNWGTPLRIITINTIRDGKVTREGTNALAGFLIFLAAHCHSLGPGLPPLVKSLSIGGKGAFRGIAGTNSPYLDFFPLLGLPPDPPAA
jgi:hypothetical protein